MENTTAAALEAENEKLKIENAKLTNENVELRKLNKWYAEQFKIAQHHRFGASSEKSVWSEQMDLFNEAEVNADANLPEPTLEETITYTRKKRAGKRDELYDGLPTVQVIHEWPEVERVCQICGGALHACGHEVLRREIEVIPATVRAVEHVQTVYSCRDCEANPDDGLAVPMVKAPVPAPVIPGSGIASPSLVAFILSNKYVLALPFSRQEQEFARQDIIIPRQNMANWSIFTATRWLKPIFDLLYAVLLVCGFAQADETRYQVINEPNRKASTNSYLWIYRTGVYEEHQVVLFEYTETRAGKNPLEFLAGFSGYLNVDGYSGYYALEHNGVILCGCWAHARRKFVDVLKTAPKHLQKDSPASIGLAYCDQLFALERKYKEEGLTPEQRYERRLTEAKPILLAFFAWATGLLPALTVKGKLREAVGYAVYQQSRLMNFLLDGRLEISNNRSERGIRPVAIGRNNWMFSYSPDGADASAIIYSIVETAKANNLVPFKYLEFLFKTLPNIPREQFKDCLPWGTLAQERCTIPPP
jgi:transposase